MPGMRAECYRTLKTGNVRPKVDKVVPRWVGVHLQLYTILFGMVKKNSVKS